MTPKSHFLRKNHELGLISFLSLLWNVRTLPFFTFHLLQEISVSILPCVFQPSRCPAFSMTAFSWIMQFKSKELHRTLCLKVNDVSKSKRQWNHDNLHVLNSGGSMMVILLRFRYSGKPYRRSPLYSITTASAGQLFKQPKQAKHLSRSTVCMEGLMALVGHFLTQVWQPIHFIALTVCLLIAFLFIQTKGSKLNPSLNATSYPTEIVSPRVILFITSAVKRLT